MMKPLTFKRNRVWRVYEGGMLLDALQGAAAPEDGSFPEEWLASSVKACNYGHDDPHEGLSVVSSGGRLFTEIMGECPEELFGSSHVAKHGAAPGYLTKLLDSAIRLPLQVHPDREASAKLYNSPFGKTEAWIVLGGRKINGEEPYVMLGFNESLDEGVFRKEALSGKMPASVGMMHKHHVKPGEAMMIRGGVPHAIGPGNFILEIMEPSDWVVQPEALCGKQPLSIQDRFGMLDPAKAMDVFHYKPMSKEDAWDAARIAPSKLDSGKGFALVSMINRSQGKFFGAAKLSLSSSWTWRGGELAPFAVGVVVKGSCKVSEGSCADAETVPGGGCFLVPASCKTASIVGDAEIVFSLPPL